MQRMNGLIYSGTVISAGQSADGETPTRIVVTEEANGHAIWRESYEEGTVCIKHELFLGRDDAIEQAVAMVIKERAVAKDKGG